MSKSVENLEKVKKMGNLKLIIIVLLAVIFVGGTAFGYVVFFGSNSSSQAKESPEIYKMTLDTFTVNLSDMEYRRYLRTDITLEFFNEKAIEEAELKKHRVRDKIISILSHKSVSDFDSNQKLEKSRVELLGAVNEILGENSQIKALYFENFIIQ
ncbi:MAG TPA: hypothetical protein GX691_01915 [Clostridia bacterium]|nr:hypothetical protein [Clostridia bacterium]